MTAADLRRRIRLGEDSVLELENVQLDDGRVHSPRRDALADELAAPSVVLGVDDAIKPALDAVILKKDLADGDGRPVVRVDVPRSLFAHKSPGGCFRRIGSSHPGGVGSAVSGAQPKPHGMLR